MEKYPNKLLTMLDNMLHLHFTYEDMYEQIQINFPQINITFDEMLDVIQTRLIMMI